MSSMAGAGGWSPWPMRFANIATKRWLLLAKAIRLPTPSRPTSPSPIVCAWTVDPCELVGRVSKQLIECSYLLLGLCDLDAVVWWQWACRCLRWWCLLWRRRHSHRLQLLRCSCFVNLPTKTRVTNIRETRSQQTKAVWVSVSNRTYGAVVGGRCKIKSF